LHFSNQLQLTCTGEAVTGVSWIAFAFVTHCTSGGAHVRCNQSTAGFWMTDAGFSTRRTVPLIYSNSSKK